MLMDVTLLPDAASSTAFGSKETLPTPRQGPHEANRICPSGVTLVRESNPSLTYYRNVRVVTDTTR